MSPHPWKFWGSGYKVSDDPTDHAEGVSACRCLNMWDLGVFLAMSESSRRRGDDALGQAVSGSYGNLIGMQNA